MRVKMFPAYLAALAIPQAALAVCLSGDSSVQHEYFRSVAVVIAEVVSERTVPDPEDSESYGGIVYTVKIQETYRGSLHGTVDIFSENTSGRFSMDKGGKYILFLYRQQGQLSADNCGNSGLVGQRQEVLATVRRLAKASDSGQKPNRLLKNPRFRGSS